MTLTLDRWGAYPAIMMRKGRNSTVFGFTPVWCSLGVLLSHAWCFLR